MILQPAFGSNEGRCTCGEGRRAWKVTGLMIAGLSQLGEQWSVGLQGFRNQMYLWLVARGLDVYTYTQTPSNTYSHSDTQHKHSSLLSAPRTESRDPLFAQDQPLRLAVTLLTECSSVGPMTTRSSQVGVTRPAVPPSKWSSFLVPGSSGAERGGFVYFQYVFITKSKGCSWATRLWRQRAIVARRPDHSEIAELTGTGAVARQTEQTEFTLATELTHLIMIDHCRQKTKQPTHGKCLQGKKWEHASSCQKSRLLCSSTNWQTSKQDKPPRHPQNKTPTQIEWGDWGRKWETRTHKWKGKI